ncbi:MAG: LacI family DNA-binding transcriptional regulator [Fimbriimonas sp.]
MPTTPKVTQQEIARLAECSQATVSRVIARDPRVESAIRDKVLGVMAEHGYNPQSRSRGPRSAKTGLVGLVIKRSLGGLSSDPFFATLTAEIVQHLAETPYHLCLEVANDDRTHEEIYDEMIRTRRVDGLILVESESKDDRIGRLQSEDFPFVLIGNSVVTSGPIFSVDNDNVHAGSLATRHLIDRGYQRIGFLGGRPGVSVSEDRATGYSRTMLAAGRAPLTRSADFGLEIAQRVASEWLQEDPSVDALVVLDDNMAFGAMLAARSLSRRIPSQLGIVAFNNSSVCDIVEVGLTSVSLNISQIVKQACDRLLRTIENSPSDQPSRLLVPVELVIRGSSAGPEGN